MRVDQTGTLVVGSYKARSLSLGCIVFTKPLLDSRGARLDSSVASTRVCRPGDLGWNTHGGEGLSYILRGKQVDPFYRR